MRILAICLAICLAFLASCSEAPDEPQKPSARQIRQACEAYDRMLKQCIAERAKQRAFDPDPCEKLPFIDRDICPQK